MKYKQNIIFNHNILIYSTPHTYPNTGYTNWETPHLNGEKPEQGLVTTYVTFKIYPLHLDGYS